MQTPPQASGALVKCHLVVNTNDRAIFKNCIFAYIFAYLSASLSNQHKTMMCFNVSYVTHYLESLRFLIIQCNRKFILLVLLKSFSVHFQCFGIYFKSFAWTTTCLCSYLSKFFTLYLTSFVFPSPEVNPSFHSIQSSSEPQSANLNFGPHIYRETPPKTNTNKLEQDET